MDEIFIVKTVFVLLLMGLVVVGNIFEIRKKRTTYVHFLRYIWSVVLYSQLFCGIISSLHLLVATVAVEWIQENAICQLFGFLNLVLNSGSVWVLAIAALERYCRFVVPSEHSSTFSRRNLNLMIAGVYILVTLVATGPLYGLGEYSNLRGHLSLTINGRVLRNASVSQYGNTMNDESIIGFYLQILGKMAAAMPELNPATTIQNYLETEIGVNSRTPSFTSRGFIFILRAPNEQVAERLWVQAKNGELNSVFNAYILQLNVSYYLGRDDIRFYTYINDNEYYSYKEIYIPSQEVGVCTVDFTSVNVHATVWCVYQLIVTKGFPYIVMLIVYTIIFWKNPYVMSARDTTLNGEEIWSLKLFCSASMLCCFISTIYFSVTLCNAYGSYISGDVHFVVLFLYFCSSMSLFALDRIIESSICSSFRTYINKCWNASKTSLTQELSELSIRRESLPKTLRRVTLNKPTNL